MNIFIDYKYAQFLENVLRGESDLSDFSSYDISLSQLLNILTEKHSYYLRKIYPIKKMLKKYIPNLIDVDVITNASGCYAIVYYSNGERMTFRIDANGIVSPNGPEFDKHFYEVNETPLKLAFDMSKDNNFVREFEVYSTSRLFDILFRPGMVNIAFAHDLNQDGTVEITYCYNEKHFEVSGHGMICKNKLSKVFYKDADKSNPITGLDALISSIHIKVNELPIYLQSEIVNDREDTYGKDSTYTLHNKRGKAI